MWFNICGGGRTDGKSQEYGVRNMSKEDKLYKPSMFTHTLETEEDIIFYNSMEGIKSIQKIPKKYKEKVKEYLSAEKIVYYQEPVLDSLVRCHYIVPYDWNENVLLENLYVECSNSSVLHLIILPTEQCNFRCRYCYESFERGKMVDSVAESILKFVRKNITRYTGLKVSWFGGEPTLNIDTICKMSEAFLEICRKTKRLYWSTITSNGYLLNNSNFEKLYKANIFSYQITIDGIQSTHDCQRVSAGNKETFDTIIHNLMEIKNNKRYRHWDITIRTNFSKVIYEVIDEYFEYYYKLFHEDSRFSFLFRPVGDWGGDAVKSYEDKLLDADKLSRIFERMLATPYLLNIDRHLSFLQPGGSMCIAAHKNAFLIDSEGGIRKCSCQLDDDRNQIGQVKSGGHFELNNYRKNEWTVFRPGQEKCKGCFFLPSCLNNSCPADEVLGRRTDKKCHVYEKECLDSILRVLDRQGKIALLQEFQEQV